MSNPINLITDSIDKININLDLIESNINNPNSVDNVKDQICNICSYNEKLDQFNSMLQYAIIVQPELAQVLAATKSLTEILKQFCNACADYDTKREEALDQLKPYISQLRENLSTVQRLIDSNKETIDSIYNKTTSFNQYMPNLTQQEVQVGASNYKRKSRRQRSKRKQSNRLSKRKSIKKKSKKNRRR
jgi:hypothetical protein